MSSLAFWAEMKASLKRLASVETAVSIKYKSTRTTKRRTLRVGEADGQGNSFSLALADVGSGIPDPGAVGADIGRQLHLGDDVVVGADLEGLVAAHDQAGLAVLLVLEQANVPGAALLPLLVLLLENEELSAHLEQLLLRLLVGLGLDLLGQADYRLEVDVLGLGLFLLQQKLA